jgi:hypothetical protein
MVGVAVMPHSDPVLSTALAKLVDTPAASAGYQLVDISGGRAVELVLEKGGARFVLWLRPKGAESQSYRQTERFKVGYADEPPDRLGYNLLDRFCAQVAAWESTLSEAELARLFSEYGTAASTGSVDAYAQLNIDLERFAVQTGVKPVCRAVASAAQAEMLVAAARAAGLVVAVTEAPAFLAGFCETEAQRAVAGAPRVTTLLYVARQETLAAAAAAAERVMIESCARGQAVTDDQVRRLGAALGYPPCCIEAFLPMRDRPNAEIRFAALRRTAGSGFAVVNDAVIGRSLVSHAPCRYDCAATRTYAAALLEQLASVAPAAADALADSLRGFMVLFRSGGTLRLTAPSPRAGVLDFSAIEVCTPGPSVEAWRTALSAGETLALGPDAVTVLRDGVEVAQLAASPDVVQMRHFE